MAWLNAIAIASALDFIIIIINIAFFSAAAQLKFVCGKIIKIVACHVLALLMFLFPLQHLYKNKYVCLVLQFGHQA